MFEYMSDAKIKALQEVTTSEVGKLTQIESATKRPKDACEEELLKKEGYTEFDFEVEKAMCMFQSYPCLRYNIKSYIPILKRKVVGQDKVLEKLVYIAYFNQYVNFLEEFIEGSEYKRKSALLIAPTGCGKSTILRALEKAFGVPVHRANITATTSAGYIGDKVESMLMGLIDKAKGDLSAAERGILFIDEIDKKVTSTEKDRDVAGKAVQQELLKLFDRGTINLSEVKNNPYRIKEFHTGSLTIVMAGACVGLDEIREKRLKVNHKIGFSVEKQDKETIIDYIPKDLIEYGFIPELVGRIDMIQELEPYTTQSLIDIVYFSDESSMQEHVRILNSLGVDEIVIDAVLWERIAEKILESDLGVRELNHMVSEIFYPIMFEAFQHTSGGACVIEKDGSYTLTYKNEKETYTGKASIEFDLEDGYGF